MIKSIKLTPIQKIVLGFAVVIFTGAVLLYLPFSTNEPITFLDALFTSTSAVCVTGLVVVDTGTRYTVIGQSIIMLLIQIGGLGFMTSATLIFLILGKKIGLRERLVIQEALNQFNLQGLVRLSIYVIFLTLLFEFIGAAMLAFQFIPQFGLLKGIFFSMFHAVSAFCNAGFDLMGNFQSMTSYSENVLINIVISSLFIFGGLGYTVILDFYQKRSFKKLSLHSKIVIITTGILIVFGFLSIFGLEFNNEATLGNLSLKGKILGAYFQAVTPRTAGFNTIPIDKMRLTTLFIIICLMFIGASPCSTGGGIKTVTFAAIISTIKSLVAGYRDVNISKKRISIDIILRSFVIFFLSLSLVVVVTLVLTVSEADHATFREILFEVTSAFGTVGLSMGITTNLSSIGKILIILTMFAGRVGPLSIILALNSSSNIQRFRYSEEKIMVG